MFPNNRGDTKHFKQLYKSSEKRIDSNKETEVENNLNRSRNNRYLLVEKFRQAQGYSTDEAAATFDAQFDEEPERIDQQEEGEEEEEEEEQDSFGRLKRRHSGSSYDETKLGRGRRDKQNEEGPGFDYSSSYSSSFSDVLTFNLSRDCNESDLFNNNMYNNMYNKAFADKRDADRPLTFAAATRDSSSGWPSTASGSSSSSTSMLPPAARQSSGNKFFNWNFDDDEQLLCPKCNHNYMRINSSALVCYNCTFEHKLRSNFFSIKEIKGAIQGFLRKHEFSCDHQPDYAAKGNEIRVYCSHCSKYISI